MAARKPLVVVNGRIQQLQSGDTLAASTTEVDVITMTNADSGSHALGDVVYIFGAGSVKKARANAAGTADAIAFATAAISASASGSYQTNGYLAGFSGLTAGARYYLSEATAGLYTATAPTTVGQLVPPLGFALSTTEMWIDIEPAILL